MPKPTETEVRELADILRPYLSNTENKGGKTVPEDEFVKVKDFEHMKELEKAVALAEQYKAELEKMITVHPDPEATIKRWLECPNCRPRFESLVKPQIDEAYKKGQTDAKKNLTPDDLNVNLVGEYLRKIQAIGVGKGKGDAEYRVIKGIKVGGK